MLPVYSSSQGENDLDKSDDLMKALVIILPHIKNNEHLYRPLHDGEDDVDGNDCVDDGSSSFSSKYDDDADGVITI